MVKKERLYVTI